MVKVLTILCMILLSAPALDAGGNSRQSSESSIVQVKDLKKGQVLILVESDPKDVFAERSSCPPCNRLARDLKKHYKTVGFKDDDLNGRYIIGPQKTCLFRIVRSQGPSPRILVPGREMITGYNGRHADLIKLHPLGSNIGKR